MMQTYLRPTSPQIVRRVRQQRNGAEYLYFYTEKHITPEREWETERPITGKEYVQYLMEGDPSLRAVHKTKYRFRYAEQRMEIDVYPFSAEHGHPARRARGRPAAETPAEVRVLREVTGDPAYKNRALARTQEL